MLVQVQVHSQCGGNLDLADLDPGVAIFQQHVGLILEHHGGVAHVVADAQMAADYLVVVPIQQLPLKKVDCIVGERKHAARLRLQAQIDEPAGALLQLVHVPGGPAEVLARLLQVRSVRAGRAPTDRQRRNAPLQARRQNLVQDFDQPERVLQPLGLPPHRLINVVLDHVLMKIAVRKAIERVRHQAPLGQPVAKRRHAARGQLLGRLRRKPEAHPHRPIRAVARCLTASACVSRFARVSSSDCPAWTLVQ